MGNRLTTEEIRTLCTLYMEGQLSRTEEKALEKVLSDSTNLDESSLKIRELMDAQNIIVQEKHREAQSKRRNRTWISVAATFIVAVLTVGSLMFRNEDSDDCFEYIVWKDGKLMPDTTAQRIAEETMRIDMEMYYRLMRDQRKMLQGTYAALDPEGAY